jgi:hypothetical protein
MPSIDVPRHCEVRELIGDDGLEAVVVGDTETQRIAAAVGDGAIAISQVHEFLGGRVEAVRLAQTYVSSK